MQAGILFHMKLVQVFVQQLGLGRDFGGVLQVTTKLIITADISDVKLNNSLVIGLLSDIYGKYSNEDVIVRIYNAKNNEYEEIIISSEELISNNFRINLHKKHLKAINNFGMYTVFSEYPGFFIYSMTENSKGSVAIEHGF